MTDEGKGPRRGGKLRRHAGRLPPLVSSLFSIKAAHLKRWYQRHGAGSKGQGADGKGQRAEVGDQRSESNLELRRLAQAPLQR